MAALQLSQHSCGDEYLKHYNLIGIEGVDVRALVKNLREHGVMLGMITTEHSVESGSQVLGDLPDYDCRHLCPRGRTTRAYQWQNGEISITALHHANTPPHQWEMALDSAARVVVLRLWHQVQQILRSLRDRGLEVVVLAVRQSSGRDHAMATGRHSAIQRPGRPRPLTPKWTRFSSRLQERQAGLADVRHLPRPPIVGARARRRYLQVEVRPSRRQPSGQGPDDRQGAHHDAEPRLRGSGRFAAGQVEVTHLNLNDGTVEGLRHREKPLLWVQYHPEARPARG